MNLMKSDNKMMTWNMMWKFLLILLEVLWLAVKLRLVSVRFEFLIVILSWCYLILVFLQLDDLGLRVVPVGKFLDIHAKTSREM